MSNPDSWYDPPDEGERRCECGCDCDDHADNALEQDPQQFLADVLAIAELLDKKQYDAARQMMDKALTVCGAPNCTCRKFEPRTDDDFDED